MVYQCKDIREWTSNTITFLDLCTRGEYKKKIFTKFFFYGHSFGAFTYLSSVFFDGKLLAKYNILGILLSAPYFTMRDDPLIEIMYNPFLNSLTPTLVLGTFGDLAYEWAHSLGTFVTGKCIAHMAIIF